MFPSTRRRRIGRDTEPLATIVCVCVCERTYGCKHESALAPSLRMFICITLTAFTLIMRQSVVSCREVWERHANEGGGRFVPY